MELSPSWGYLPPDQLWAAAKGQRGKARVWLYNGRPTTVGIGKEFFRRRGAFKDLTHDELGTLVENYRTRTGKPATAPSSYSTVFYADHKNDKGAPHGVNSALRAKVPGPWCEAQAGICRPAHLWDIRSAYFWAALRGLPNPKTYRPMTFGDDWKIALCKFVLHDVAGPFPPPLEAGVQVGILTREEREAYQADVYEIYQGFTWDGVERDYFADLFGGLADAYGPKIEKQIRRAYWGRWMASTPLECRMVNADGSTAKSWFLKNREEDQIRAHIIQSRIRIRLYQALKKSRTYRVYVDSILTDTANVFDEGTEPGDWGHVASWADGVRVVHASHYVNAKTGEILAGAPAMIPK